jgi:hypothetical protein
MRDRHRPSCLPGRATRAARPGALWAGRFNVNATARSDFPPGLELLKFNLLNRALRTFCEPHFERPLRRAADQAARLAAATGYPMLVFPELFAEIAIPAMVETEYRLRGGFHFASRFQP